MRRLIIGALVALAVLVVGAGVAVRYALQPGSLKPIVEARLGALLGARVTVGRLDIDLLPTPQVVGGDIVIGAAGGPAAPSLRLDGLEVVPRLAPLLGGRLVIDRIQLDGLEVRVRRDAAGVWHLPGEAAMATGAGAGAAGAPAAAAAGGAAPRAAGGSAVAGGPVASRTSGAMAIEVADLRLAGGRVAVEDDVRRGPGGSPEVATITDVAARVEVRGGEVLLRELSARLGGSTLTGSGRVGSDGVHASLGWSSLGASDLPLLFGLAGTPSISGFLVEGKRPLDVELSVTPGGALSVKGTVRADRMALDTLSVESAEAPIAFDGKRLVLDPLVFRGYGGSERGRLVVALGPPVEWSLEGAIEGVDVNRFLSANTLAKDQLSGIGRLGIDVKGSVDPPIERGLAGTLDLRLASGVIRHFRLLAAINRALGVTGGDLEDTRFEKLSATLSLAGGIATTRDLRVQAGEMTLTAAGTIGLSSLALDLTGTATLSPAKTAELTKVSGELRNLRNEQGLIEIPLRVTGTSEAPVIAADLRRALGAAAKYQLEREVGKGLKRLLKKR